MKKIVYFLIYAGFFCNNDHYAQSITENFNGPTDEEIAEQYIESQSKKLARKIPEKEQIETELEAMRNVATQLFNFDKGAFLDPNRINEWNDCLKRVNFYLQGQLKKSRIIPISENNRKIFEKSQKDIQRSSQEILDIMMVVKSTEGLTNQQVKAKLEPYKKSLDELLKKLGLLAKELDPAWNDIADTKNIKKLLKSAVSQLIKATNYVIGVINKKA